MSDRSVIDERLAMLPRPGEDRWADRYAVDVPYLLASLSMHEPPWVKPEADVGLLRRVLSEYVAGNRIVDGYWYSPDENGEPHNLNQPATPDELALIETLRTEDEQ